MTTTHAPSPSVLDTDELNELRCQLHSGVEPTLEQGRRLLATVEALQTALLWRKGREE